MRCSRCLQTYYCSQECQHEDWKRHKAGCKEPTVVAEEPAVLNESIFLDPEKKKRRQRDIAAYEDYLRSHVQEDDNDGADEDDLLAAAPYQLPASLLNAIKGEAAQAMPRRPYSAALGSGAAAGRTVPAWPTGESSGAQELSISERLAKLGMDELRGL